MGPEICEEDMNAAPTTDLLTEINERLKRIEKFFHIDADRTISPKDAERLADLILMESRRPKK
jgi:hypothetical protein